jgi:hypothetical protein
MTMPTFETGVPQSIYTITDLRVARWDGTEYGTVVALAEGQTLQFEPQADTDEKKSYGLIRRLLTVLTHVNFNIGVGLVQANAIWVMAGVTQSVSGSGDSLTQRLRFDAGGSGLPYFGVVGNFASDDLGDVIMGIPLCKLDAPPSLSSEQNQFILPESSGKGIANSLCTNTRACLYIDQNKVAQTISDFNSFFGVA